MGKGNIVFIIGSVRSGSTLLRLMLSSHPEIHIFADGPYQAFLKKIKEKESGKSKKYEVLSRFDLLNRSEVRELISSELDPANKIIKLFEKERNLKKKTMCGIQLHGDYDIIKKAFPGAKFIHLIRDPRAVCKSMVGIRAAGNYYYAARLWVNLIEEVEKLGTEVPRHDFLIVKYEDLISRAEDVLKKICSFVGVDYSGQMLQYARENRNFSLPDLSRIDAWRYEIKKKYIYQIESVVGKKMKEYGYPPLCPHVRDLSNMSRLFLFFDNRFKHFVANLKFFGTINYLGVKVNQCLGIRVFKKAEEACVRIHKKKLR